MSEIRHAIRRLGMTPVVTASAITCLAIGIWMTCIMTALGRGFYRPNLQVAAANRLVQLETRGLYTMNPWRGAVCCGRLSSRAVFDSLATSPVFAAVGHYTVGYVRLDYRPRKATYLSAGMMAVLHIRPLLGRVFVPPDDSSNSAVIISHHLWRTIFGGDSGIIGRRLAIRPEPIPRTIVGVMREDFMFPRDAERPDLYLPAHWPVAGRSHYPPVTMLARLGEGVRAEAALEAVRGIVTRNVSADRHAMVQYWRSARPGAKPRALPHGPVDVRLERYYNEPIPPIFGRFMVLVIACGFAVVVIAAANVMNLLLVRGGARRQEIAVRMALGATRLRIVRELVLETSLLAAAGCVIGFLAAAWQWSRLDRGFSARHIFGEIDGSIAITAAVMGFALTLVVGLWPGLRATSMHIEHVLRDARRSGPAASPLDGVLGRMVAVSTAVTVVLLICAVLFAVSARTTIQELGGQKLFGADITLQQESPTGRIADGRETLTRIRGMPNVESAAIGVLPPGGTNETLLMGREGHPSAQPSSVTLYTVSDGFFRTASIPLLHGREFSARETRDSTGLVIVNRPLALRLFPGRTALGERFTFRRGEDSPLVEAIVIGVADDSRVGGPTPALYLPLGSGPPMLTSVLMRLKQSTKPDLATALRPVRGVIASAAFSIAERRTAGNAVIRYVLTGFTMFAVVALLLAAVGTYGVVAYSVIQRTHEMGVRMALGASPGRVRWMVIEDSLKVALVGIIAGLVLAAGAARLIEGFIEGADMKGPLSIAGVIGFVGLIALVASAIPAYRAGRLNPVEALRAE